MDLWETEGGILSVVSVVAQKQRAIATRLPSRLQTAVTLMLALGALCQ